jgi:NAD(P)-dependent dehydrogenase (short-subunit alcohol dehydrogenase family)
MSRGGVLITGASSGIGAAVAQELAEQGLRVFGTIRRPEDGAALTDRGVVPIPMDVTNGPSIVAARVAVEAALGGRALMGLVNNAGIPIAGPLELVPLADLRRVLEVNLVGAVAVTQTFLPLLKASRGRIVNISSIAGRSALPFLGPYAASKFALEAVSDSLRRELAPFGVDVIVIQPGNIQSKIWDRVEALDLAPYRGTPYERVLERFRERALRRGRRAPPATLVARAVYRALTARRPPIRVLVSARPRMDKMIGWLPDRVMDWLVQRTVWRRTRTPGSG